MDKETLSNYGWVVICTLVIAIMIALATPFGEYIANGVKSTTTGLTEVLNKSLTSTGYEELDNILGDNVQDGFTGTKYIRAKAGTTGYVDEYRKYVYGVKEGHNPLNYFEPINATNYIEMSQGTAQSGVTNATGSVLTVYNDSTKSEVLATYTLIIFGELDGDGVVTVGDFGYVQYHVAGKTSNLTTNEKLFAADVTADGVLDKYDENRILKHVVAHKLIPNNVYATTELLPNIDTEADIDYSINCVYGVPARSNPLDYFVATNDGCIEMSMGEMNKLIVGKVPNGTGAKLTLYADSSKTKVIEEYTLIVFGDVDRNGLVDTNDAQSIIDYLKGIKDLSDDLSYYAGDINCDGELDETDVDMITDYIGGNKFPVNIWAQ